jgi:ribose transport system ATP-binding protein
VSVAKWLATNPSVLLLDEPTRGIDVEAKQQIFDIIWDLSRRGIASIVVSSELEELLLLCDRILIMRGGRTGEEVHAAAVTLDRLLALCFA